MGYLLHERDRVPPDLRDFDVARWQAAAEADTDSRRDGGVELYAAALVAAGIDETTRAQLVAAAVVAKIRSRIAAHREEQQQ